MSIDDDEKAFIKITLVIIIVAIVISLVLGLTT